MSRSRISPVPVSLFGLALLAAGGCSPPPPPNVLLISLDACRADHLSSYGYPRETSPFLDELAAGGTRFENAFANTLGTTPSHTTILSSLYQEEHGVELDGVDGKPVQLPESLVTLPGLLAEAGYRTVAVTGGGLMHRRFGFDRHFEVYLERHGIAEGADELVRRVEAHAAEEGPLFAFLHTYEVHSPYVSPGDYDSLFGEARSKVEPTSQALLKVANVASQVLSEEDFEFLVAQYDRGIRYTDDTLRSTFGRLRSLGFLDRAVVVVTADHGEEFGEHGRLLHGGRLYDETMRVPLIWAGAGVKAGTVEDALVSTIDIAPTLLAHLGLPVPQGMSGRDVLRAGSAEALVFAQFRRDRYSVRSAAWKLIDDSVPARRLELYDLLADPGEQLNVADRNPRVVRRLLGELERWRAGLQPVRERAEGTEPTEAQREQLRALGYVE